MLHPTSADVLDCHFRLGEHNRAEHTEDFFPPVWTEPDLSVVCLLWKSCAKSVPK